MSECQFICQKCGRGWSICHTCPKDGSVTLSKGYSVGLESLLKLSTLEFEKDRIIIAFQLGRMFEMEKINK